MKGATWFGGWVRFNVPISIHAPVKGATGFDYVGGRVVWISIHAPVKGATLICVV